MNITTANTSPNYWAFNHYSKSTQAQKLVNNLFTSLNLHVGKTNTLSERQLQSRKLAFDRCLSSLIARSRLCTDQQLYRSLDKATFDKQAEFVSGNSFKLITEKMTEKGYLLHKLGKLYPEEDFDNPDGSKAQSLWRGKASHYTPTPKFFKLVRKYGLKKKGLSAHFGKDKPKNLVQVKTASISNGRYKIKGKKVVGKAVLNDPNYKLQLKEMKAINDYLIEQHLGGGEFTGLKRSFNNYTEEDYGWDAGGRMYDIDQNGYQKLPEGARAKMTINGEPVVEIDIEACFLSILFGLMNKPLPNKDMYKVKGMRRAVVKSWMTISLTNGKLLTKWPPKARSGLINKHPDQKIPTAGKVKEAVLEAYPWLKRLSDEGIGWPKLQYIESSIMLLTIKDLIAQNIPAYPVHDSVIVPASARVRAIEILKRRFETEVGVRPRID